MELPLPPPTRYDQAARYLLLRAGALLFSWLLRLTPAQLRFERWLPTQLTLPGARQRLCDGIAELADLRGGGRPFAAILEVQTAPDATMTGRLLLAGGLLWLTVKPARLPGDRYELVGVGPAGRRRRGSACWARPSGPCGPSRSTSRRSTRARCSSKSREARRRGSCSR
jgi:hypothetical protein